MDAIRDFLKSWPGRILMMLCLAPLALFGLDSYFRGGGSDNVVASIGETNIFRQAYQSALTNQRQELIAQGVDASMINEPVLQQEVLEGLIHRALLEQQAQKLGMSVSDTRINDMLLKDSQFLDDSGNFSNERFAFMLKQQGLTKDQLFNEYRQQMGISQLYDGVTQTVIYPSQSVRKLVAEQEQTKPIWRLTLPWEQYADAVTVSQSDIEDYYHEHEETLKSKAMVDLSYIELKPEQVQIEPVTAAELQAQYEAYIADLSDSNAQNLSQILLTAEDAEATLAVIQDKLQAGESFAELAKTYSQDEGSRNNGGSIGQFNPEVFGEDASVVTDAIAGLTTGEVSDPVKTQYGWHLFQVTGGDDNALPTLEAVTPTLTTQIEARKRADEFAQKVTRINEMATDGVSLEEIAQAEGLSINTLDDYVKTDNQTSLNQPAIIQQAFDEFAIQDGSVSADMQVDNRTIWLQSSNYRPIMPLSLEQAQEQIRQAVLKEKASQIAMQKAQEIAQQVNDAGLQAVENKYSFEALGEVNRQYPLLDEQEVSVAFSEHHDSDTPVAKVASTSSGASVLVLGKTNVVQASDVPDTDVQLVAQMLRQGLAQQEFTDYLEYLKLANPVEKNDAVIEEITGN